MDFDTLANKIHQQRDHIPVHMLDVTLCFDPGHTTGWAAFRGLKLMAYGELDSHDIPTASHEVQSLFNEFESVGVVVIEDYRIYKWRAKHHIGSDMLTTRVIGCIETLAYSEGIGRIVKQPANITAVRLRSTTFCRIKPW